MPSAAGLYYFLHESDSLSRPPILLIHGAGGNCFDWPPEIRRLAGGRVFTLDLPGHGKSEGFGWQSISDYARSVIGFMDAAGMMQRALIVGHSMGGAIALEMALQHRERVAGLGLIATGARLPLPSTILDDAASPTTIPLAIQALSDLLFGSQADPALRAASTLRLSRTRPAVLHGDLLACDAFDAVHRLRRIHIPALVICGIEDRLTPLQYSQTLAAQIPGAALQTVDGTGHMVMLEQPRRVASLLSVFLATLPYTPGA
jgi:pimeloyl-ACP methyl ester carboxylesterase